jgi:hypothetical protein
MAAAPAGIVLPPQPLDEQPVRGMTPGGAGYEGGVGNLQAEASASNGGVGNGEEEQEEGTADSAGACVCWSVGAHVWARVCINGCKIAKVGAGCTCEDVCLEYG